MSLDITNITNNRTHHPRYAYATSHLPLKQKIIILVPYLVRVCVFNSTNSKSGAFNIKVSSS